MLFFFEDFFCFGLVNSSQTFFPQSPSGSVTTYTLSCALSATQTDDADATLPRRFSRISIGSLGPVNRAYRGSYGGRRISVVPIRKECYRGILMALQYKQFDQIPKHGRLLGQRCPLGSTMTEPIAAFRTSVNIYMAIRIGKVDLNVLEVWGISRTSFRNSSTSRCRCPSQISS
jgi:hypothetical protein